MIRGKDAILTAPLLTNTELARQIALERECMVQGAMAYHESVARITEAGEGSHLKAAEPLFQRWFGPVHEAIRADLRLIRKKSSEKGVNYWGPVLLHFGLKASETLAAVALHETVSMCLKNPDGVKVASLAYHIGRDLMAHQMMDIAAENDTEQLESLKDRYRDITARLVFWWGRKRLREDGDWERKFATHAGARLLWHVVCNCDCSVEGEEFKLAFHHVRRQVRLKGGRRVTPAFIDIDDRVLDVLERNHNRRAGSRPRYTYMLVEPMPWTEKTSGNYVKHKTSIFTRSSREQQRYADTGDMRRIHEAVNAINATPWRINLWILATMQEFWNRGGNVVGVPRDDDKPLPEPGANPTPEELSIIRRLRYDARKENRKLKAERILFIRALGVAERFADEPRFWCPHLLDFRGRFYARPLYLNHNEDDTRRGLIEFANRVTPGPEGERALRIHAANCYGVDKVSFDARIEWVETHAGEIERCVRDPIAEEFWQHAENPWQFLAACRALVNDDAACHLPTQWDGSCNGLQHYTAMGRDEVAAPLVNLVDGEIPGDIYQAIADVIHPTINRDAAESEHIIRYRVFNGTERVPVEKPVREIAETILGILSRKVVKQPVMTSVYGVTAAGARDQIIERLKELEFDRQSRYEGAAYLSRVVLNGIGEKCRAASQIMGWLTECGRTIAKGGKPVTWTSPMGLPVIQPYRRHGKYEIDTLAGKITVFHEDDDAPVAVGRQADGIAPNFVHSIDASHAMMTALRCRQSQIDTAFNHDSYWTHAGKAKRLNQILRKTFVELHSEPLLWNMHNELQAQTDTELPPPPPPGNLDLGKVIGSTYFFH